MVSVNTNNNEASIPTLENVDDIDQEEETYEIVEKCHVQLTKNAKLVLTFWVLAFMIGGYFSSYFINKAEDRLEAPFHSRAGKFPCVCKMKRFTSM